MDNKSTIKIDPSSPIGKISPNIYGHFAEHVGGVIYDGVWVGENTKIPNINGIRLELIKNLKEISPSVIRWPGGCFAETYDWRDGIGKERKVTSSWWTSKDGLYESNAFGTHEFIELCRLVNASPYIAVNTTSLSPQYARDWMDYCNSPQGSTYLSKLREENGSAEPFNVIYWGVGNENWGGGGNMTAEQYAMEYRKYATVLKNLCPSSKLIAAAGNYHSENWTRTFFKTMKEYYGTKVAVDGISFHYYYSDEEDIRFDGEGWKRLIDSALEIENQIKMLVEILKEYELENKVKIFVDEWGAMYDKSESEEGKNQLYRQQVTMRDAVAAAVCLNIFNKYAKHIEMANIAQLTNCLSALFLSDENGFIATPVYHIYSMFGAHQNAEAIEASVTDPEISCSASISDSGIFITAANTSCTDDKALEIELPIPAVSASATILRADELCGFNSFDLPDRIAPKEIEIETDGAIRLPRGSVIAISIKV